MLAIDWVSFVIASKKIEFMWFNKKKRELSKDLCLNVYL